MMERTKYRVLLCAADYGSFSKAAELTGYTPSGVAHMMNAVEAEFGFPIFLRGRRGVSLTEDGKRVLPVLRELARWDEQLAQTVSEIRGLSTGVVTIGAYSSIASHWLPPVIKRFKRDFPGIRVRLMEGIRQEVELWLAQRRVDLAFYSYQEPMPYEWIPLKDDPMLAVLPADHPLAGAAEYPVEACMEENFIMPALGRDDDVAELLSRLRLAPRVSLSTLENYAAMCMIEQGLGMSIMNELITKNWDCDVALLPLRPPQHITLGIAVPALAEASPAARKFVAYARELAE